MGAITYLKYWMDGQLIEEGGQDLSQSLMMVRVHETMGNAKIIALIEHGPISL
jgi:hypothetical protein